MNPFVREERIRVDHLSRTFRNGKKEIPAVVDVSFVLHAGETLGLVGESGCGKSTIARMLTGIEHPDTGTVDTFGNGIQMIFQDPYASLNPRKRVQDLICDPMIVLQGCYTGKALSRAEKLLLDVGLDASYLHRFPHELSGGQRQRISIARALSLNPSVLICDEAVSALDMSVQAQILNLLLDLQKKRDLSMLFISHSIGAVRYVSDRIAVMYLGRIVESGDSADICESPRHPYTAMLMASVPKPDPCSRTDTVFGITGEVPEESEALSGCPFYARCPYADEACAAQVPALLPLALADDPHMVACFHKEVLSG